MTETDGQRQTDRQRDLDRDRTRAKETEGDVCDNSPADNPTGFLL